MASEIVDFGLLDTNALIFIDNILYYFLAAIEAYAPMATRRDNRVSLLGKANHAVNVLDFAFK